MSSLRVLKYFISSSPVGELSDVLEDISNIIGHDFLQQPEIKQALRDYYENHKLQLNLNDGSQVIVSGHGRQEPISRFVGGSAPVQQQVSPQKKASIWDEDGDEQQQQQEEEQKEEQQDQQIEQQQQQQVVEEFVYYDPSKRCKFSFHPITLEAKLEEENVDLSAASLPANVLSLRDETIKEMQAYVNRQFRKGTTLHSVFVDESSIKVEISCHNFNFKNFWGGEFISSYNIELGSENFSGSVKLHNHYFEQGNIQFNLKKAFPPQKLKTLSAKAIVDLICKLETDYQEGLEEMYNEVSEKLLKGMRRILPVTRTKFDWNRPNLI